MERVCCDAATLGVLKNSAVKRKRSMCKTEIAMVECAVPADKMRTKRNGDGEGKSRLIKVH